MNRRRASRNIGDGVRLDEASGTISTPETRAAARLDHVRTRAVSNHLRIR